MNIETVTLTVVYGGLRGHEFVFEDGNSCVIGRAEDCDLRLPTNLEHAAVSRHHCVLEIDWPTVWLRDLGSRNGKFLNGENIGQRRSDGFQAEADLLPTEAHKLHDGDKIRVGHTLFRVNIGAAMINQDALMAALTHVG